jgi:methyl-accepting chemotaxis protein
MLDTLIELFKKDNRRSIRNYLLNPKVQLRMGFFVSINIIFAVVAAIYFARIMSLPLFDTLVINTDSDLSPELFSLFEETTRSGFMTIIAFAICHGFIISMITVWYTHRIIGPIIAFRRHVQALTNGNTSSRIKLRDHDAFTALADELNELAAHYGQKYPKS